MRPTTRTSSPGSAAIPAIDRLRSEGRQQQILVDHSRSSNVSIETATDMKKTLDDSIAASAMP